MYKQLVIFTSIILLGFNTFGQTKLPDLVLYEFEADSGVAITSHSKNVILIFTKENCPYVDAYNKRINHLSKTFSEYQFIIVNVGPQDMHNKYNFKVITDPDKKIAKVCSVTRTPEVIVLNGLNVIYKGALDDNPLAENDVRNNYLISVLNNLRKGIKPKVHHKSFGCIIRH